MIRGVHHVAVSTHDLDRLVAFYTELFGFEVVMSTSWSDRPVIDSIVGLEGSAARQAMLKSGNAYIEVFEYESHDGHGGPDERTAADKGYTHFCVDATNIEEEYERLKGLGMTFSQPAPIDVGHVKSIYGRDPEGNLIEIQQTADNCDFPLSALPSVST